MAELDDIRQGVAANLAALRTSQVVGQVSAYLLDNPTPPSLMVAGIDSDGVEYLTFDQSSVRWTVLVEACLGKVSDIGSQKVLNRLLSPGADSLVGAVEANITLTSRYRGEADGGEGTVLTGQAPAADSLAFSEYRGQTPFILENGARVLLATWAFEVVT